MYQQGQNVQGQTMLNSKSIKIGKINRAKASRVCYVSGLLGQLNADEMIFKDSAVNSKREGLPSNQNKYDRNQS